MSASVPGMSVLRFAQGSPGSLQSIPKVGTIVPNMGNPSTTSPVSMSDALFPATRQRVLGLFFGQAWRDFSISELIAEAEAGSGGVQRELKRLTDSGLVVAKPLGKQRRYRANADSPVFAELCSLVRKILGPSDQVRTALAPLADDIEVALLFGSVAKGTDTAQSDIDVLVVSDRLTLERLFEVFEEAEASLGRPIQPTLYTSDEFRRRREQRSPFVRKVLAGDYVVLLGQMNG
ncbi:MAG: nucleotidyltransferase domain-containing protein [Myxococcales bacterium]|nr:nucleotidyltransferase domain-containing protein [Myxococcales bacterium]